MTRVEIKEEIKRLEEKLDVRSGLRLKDHWYDELTVKPADFELRFMAFCADLSVPQVEELVDYLQDWIKFKCDQGLEEKPEFKVGDRVIVTNDYSYGITKKGSYGVVTSVFDEAVKVTFEHLTGNQAASTTNKYILAKEDLALKED